jgi:hypothetical protein
MSEQREKILKRLRAMLAMTAANGASEAEAMMAAEKASELMTEYDLSFEDVEQVRAERYGARKREFRSGSARRRTSHESSLCVGRIARLFDCRTWMSGQDLVFFGAEHDTESAHYLTDVVRVAMDCEVARYLRSADRPDHIHGKTLRTSFLLGMAIRINQRIDDMIAVKHDKSQNSAGTGTALVVLEKSKIVTERFASYSRDNGLKLQSTTQRRSVRSGAAMAAGQSAGSRVALGTGISGKATGKIGHSQ